MLSFFKFPFRLFKMLGICVFMAVIVWSCRADDETAEPAAPNLTNVEIGHDNDEIGTIGEDVHFNAEVQAGGSIDRIEINIKQRAGITYSNPWDFTIIWDEYKGQKNAHIHKHIDIPADAAEGKYDFIITVYDVNSTKLVDARTIQLYLEENLPPGHHHDHDH